MIGDIFWSCVGLGNEVLGDPIGGVCDIIDDSNRRSEIRERSKPSNVYASEKMWLYTRMNEYKDKLDDEIKSTHPSKRMIEFYTKYYQEYKEKLQLLS